MNDLTGIFELERAYIEAFSRGTDTDWGTLYCNENQPDYYDANHAHILKPIKNPQPIIKEVIKYYQTKGIIPRFYIYNLEFQKELISQLKEQGFGFEELVSPIQLWNKEIVEQTNLDEIIIELVTNDNFSEARDIECSIKEFGGKSVREKAFEHEFNSPLFTYYLLRYKGKACATACLFIKGTEARMESVATLEKYRGKGLIGYLIRHIQIDASKMDLENLWVFPINEQIERVYQKYGFSTVETLKMGHAYLAGRSIKEIQK